jgi:uncharacterized protein YkwD
MTETTVATATDRLRLVARVLGFSVALVAAMALFQGTAAADSQDDEMMGYINQARAAAGKPALTSDPALSGVALRWATTMGDKNQLFHNPSMAADVDRSVTTAWTRIGENVGVGSDMPRLHQAFMNSPGHYANIMGDYNRIGVGHVYANGRLWVTVNFMKGPAIAPPPPPAVSFQPFRDAVSFVNQQYVDFMGRSADAAGRSFWSWNLTTGAATPTSMIDSFLQSPEFGSTAAPVARLYFAYFNRMPDYGGLTFWMGRIRSGASIFEVSSSFVQSAEFISTYGALDSTEFVQRVYQNVLNRSADPSGLYYWVSQLGTAMNRGQVMVNFSESPEYRMKKQAEVNVLMVYVGMLRRVPDASGNLYWVSKVRSGSSIQSLIGGFMGSGEYAARVV